jgi:hypothetical protein
MNARLAMNQIDQKAVDSIVDGATHCDGFRTALGSEKGMLISQYKRKRYYETHLQYIEPVEVSLGPIKYVKLSKFHYVPFRNSLQALLQDSSF